MIVPKIYVYRGRLGGALYAAGAIEAGERVFRFPSNIDTARILAHSERPNCALLADDVVALRDITIGEEITCDHHRCAAAIAG